MANSKEFSHITVTADDDDDVIIQAGVVEESAAEEPVDEPAAADSDSAVEGVVEESVVEEAPASPEQGAESLAPAASSAAAKADGASYHETALEDLESAKMSTIQKAIIVVAALGIVAFAAWYLLAH